MTDTDGVSDGVLRDLELAHAASPITGVVDCATGANESLRRVQ
jgi:hypothetical protein